MRKRLSREQPLCGTTLFKGLQGRGPKLGSLTTPCFAPYLFKPKFISLYGCGAIALSVLTGVSPLKIVNPNRKKEHWTDRFMLDFLRKRDFLTVKISPIDLLGPELENHVTEEHVVLLSHWVKKDIATWAILYRMMYFHNFEMYDLNALEFINRPVLTAYAVFHPRWIPLEK